MHLLDHGYVKKYGISCRRKICTYSNSVLLSFTAFVICVSGWLHEEIKSCICLQLIHTCLTTSFVGPNLNVASNAVDVASRPI